MSLNIHTSKILWNVANGSKPCGALSRHLRSHARPIPPLTSLPFSKSTSRPAAIAPFAASHDIHARKRRRYSAGPRASAGVGPDVLSDRQIHEILDPAGEGDAVAQPVIDGDDDAASSRSVPRHKKKERRRNAREGDEDGDAVVVRPPRHEKDDSGAKAPGNKPSKKRLELRDLAVRPKAYRKNDAEPWQTQKEALKDKFGDAGWNPRKKLSPDTMEGIRALHAENPDKYSTPMLAEHFKVSPEAVRRILKSKWRPSEKEMDKRRERWAKRHDRIWDQMAELGLRPKRSKDRALEEPDEFEENLKAKEILDNARNA